MEESATKKKRLFMPDWTLLPDELLHVISTHLKDCFDVVHARSFCISWRSTFPFPACLLRPRYSLPKFHLFPYKSKGFCTLEKIPLFLFRVKTPRGAAAAASSPSDFSAASSPSEFSVGRLDREDHTKLPFPLQCSVKVKIKGSDPTLMNMLDCHILPVDHKYRMIGYYPKDYLVAAFIPLNKEGGREFVVLLNFEEVLWVLTSAEMKWKRLNNLPDSFYWMELATFRGRFYVAFDNEEIFVIDPYSLEATPLMITELLGYDPCDHDLHTYLVPSGNDELFLVETLDPRRFGNSQLTCRVSRLDEEAGKWVVVPDLGDRVLFIGDLGNICCSANSCGVSGNTIVFTNQVFKSRMRYWESSPTEKRVTILSTSPVVALPLELENLCCSAKEVPDGLWYD